MFGARTKPTTPIIGEVHTNFKERSPLWLALRYESPVSKFEEVVASNHSWVNLKTDPAHKWVDVAASCSILAECAQRGLTNHVRVLLEAGADADEAIGWHRKYGWDEAADLIDHEREEMEQRSASK
jgi:hypothetical protein